MADPTGLTLAKHEKVQGVAILVRDALQNAGQQEDVPTVVLVCAFAVLLAHEWSFQSIHRSDMRSMRLRILEACCSEDLSLALDP